MICRSDPEFPGWNGMIVARLKIVSYAAFTDSQPYRFDRPGSDRSLGEFHSRRFHYRLQLVEGDRAGQHLGRDAVVQHCAGSGRVRVGLFRAVDRACARAALCRNSSARLPLVFPAGSGRACRGCHLLRFGIDRLLERHAFLRLARARRAGRCLERSGFFRGLCRFTCSILPFYSQVLGFVFVLAILCALVFWATARGWQFAERFRYGAFDDGPRGTITIGPESLLLPGATRAGFVRIIAVILLLGLAAWVFLGNYDLLLQLARLHDRRGLRGPKDHASPALAAHCRHAGGAAAGLDAQIQARPSFWSPASLSCNWLCRASCAPSTCGPTKSPSSGPTSSATSRPPPPPSAWIATRPSVPFVPHGTSNGRSGAGRHAARQHSSVGLARLQRDHHPDSGAAPLLHFSRTPTWTAIS